MATLSLGGWQSQGTVAVASDGQLLAALDAGSVSGVRGIGLASMPGRDALVARALSAAGVAPVDVTHIAMVGESLAVTGASQEAERALPPVPVGGVPRARTSYVDADQATALFAARVAPGSRVLYAGRRGGWYGTAAAVTPIGGYPDLAAASQRIATALAGIVDDVWSLLQHLAQPQHAARWEPATAAVLRPGRGSVHVDVPCLEALLAEAVASVNVPLDQIDSPHLGLKHLRSGIAAAWLARVGEVLRAGIEGVDVWAGAAGVLPAVAGTQWSTAIPCPDARGAVIGAAIGDGSGTLSLQHVGEAADETAVKAALERARLDYLYEPRPERLMDRVSTLLASGRLVGWFEGRSDIGDVPSGARVVLADAAERYSRDNVNVYLCRRAVDHPLTVAMTGADARYAFGAAPARGRVARYTVPAAHAASFEGAATRHGTVDVVTVDEGTTPALHRLLWHHAERTGRPAPLIVSPLADAGRPAAAQPADALAVTYATPVDALVLGRFVVFKDYWLLRSGLTPS